MAKPLTIRERLERARSAEYVSPVDLALLLQCAPQTIYRRVKTGTMPGVKRLGRLIRIHRVTALEALDHVSRATASSGT